MVPKKIKNDHELAVSLYHSLVKMNDELLNQTGRPYPNGCSASSLLRLDAGCHLADRVMWTTQP
jgi:cystathionine beta-lyase family protein involved in aluminum resistance